MARPRRLRGFSYIGCYRYFLTTCTFQRHPTFRDHDVATKTIAQFLDTAKEEQFDVLAYCFMPDHAHLLVEGLTTLADLQRFTKTAKQESGAAYALTAERRLWQKGFHDHVLREHEDPRAVARYIIENPVRAGLVESPEQYPYSGSCRWSIRELMEWTTTSS